MQACIRARAPFGVGVGVGTLPPSCRELIEDEYGVVWCVHGACSSAGRRCINVNNGMFGHARKLIMNFDQAQP